MRLTEALKARDRDTWIDWKDIPLTADWLAEIYSGIEAADNFVFVLSPDSITSEACGLEIAHAVKHNKRLVPIVRRDVDDKAVPQALAALNWTFLREGDDFDSAFQSLIEAIDTDLEWVREHTRLLKRAIEWDSKERDNSFVLRGSDLQEAEQWLAESEGKESEPTVLHTQYILASRQDATRRQRTTLGVVAFGLIVAIVLCIAAGVAALVALDRSQVAQAEAQIALSRELAAVAIAQLEVDPELGLLLAIEAVETEYTMQAEDALRQALASPWRASLRGHTREVDSAVYSPDGRWIVTASGDGTARVWDAANGQQKMALWGHMSSVSSAAYSPDGRWIVTASGDGTARVWDAVSGQQKMELKHTSWVFSAAYSPDGQWIVTASNDGAAWVWWWGADAGDLLAEARSRLARELTCQERVQYLHEDLDCEAEE